jgi:hypothetical protein
MELFYLNLPKKFMRNKPFFAVLLPFMMLLSCNSAQKDDVAAENQSNADEVTLTLEAAFLHNDKFQIYYTNEPNVELSGENLIDKYVYGNGQMQKIDFKFPKGVIPYKIRLDLGENTEQKSISVKNISIHYKDHVINGDDGDFMKSWTTNEALVYDTNKFIYNIELINGLHDPLFITSIDLEKKLLKFRKDD